MHHNVSRSLDYSACTILLYLGKQCGLGMYTWKDKSGYVGQLNNGQFEGFGVYTYEPDSVYKCYEGSWKNDKQGSIQSKFTSQRFSN